MSAVKYEALDNDVARPMYRGGERWLHPFVIAAGGAMCERRYILTPVPAYSSGASSARARGNAWRADNRRPMKRCTSHDIERAVANERSTREARQYNYRDTAVAPAASQEDALFPACR